MTALMLLAQNFAAWTIGQWAIFIVIAAGLVAIVWIALRAMKVPIPEWVVQVLWVLVIVVVCVLAIKFLIGLF